MFSEVWQPKNSLVQSLCTLCNVDAGHGTFYVESVNMCKICVPCVPGTCNCHQYAPMIEMDMCIRFSLVLFHYSMHKSLRTHVMFSMAT
jgi:hypothetical protein